MSQPDAANLRDDGSPEAFSTLGLCVKLILLPGSLVLVLVMIVVIFGWLTLSPGDVDSLVDALGKRGNTRWRAAVELAAVLRDPGNVRLKSDPVLAGRLTDVLKREIEAGRMHNDQITLRVYLCRALGEFHIPDALPVLVEAAEAQRDEREADVRRSAIEAIAVLASNVGPARLRSQPGLMSVLLETAEDTRAPLRSAAAFTLGVVGGTEAQARLEILLTDGHPDVRYNAATGLARHGNVKGVEVLLEMLDPTERAGIDVEKQEPARDSKRAMILINALRATSQLASANPTADMGRLTRAIERLSQADVDKEIRLKAVQVLSELEGPTR